jgi:hypothetical protein
MPSSVRRNTTQRRTVPPVPQPVNREQPKTLEEAEKRYPPVGAVIQTVGGTYPDRRGVVTGITNKEPKTGWLFLLKVTLYGGVVEHSWTVAGPANGKPHPVTQRHAVKEQEVRLQPGSWKVIELPKEEVAEVADAGTVAEN